MLFHSQGFVLLFLPIAVAIYYALAKRQEAREWWLIAASLFFYGWWDVRFVPIADVRLLTPSADRSFR